MIRAALDRAAAAQGRRHPDLTETVSSPTLGGADSAICCARFPSAKWHQWDPAGRDNTRAGAKIAFGEYVDAQYRFDQADVILSLDADFLGSGPGGAALRARLRRAPASGAGRRA